VNISVLPPEFRKQHITIDVEEWFHIIGVKIPDVSEWDELTPTVENNTRKILKILKDTSNVATFFFLGWVAKKYPDLVKEVHDAGHEVASHGFYHKDIRGLSDEEFYQDIRDAKLLLEDITSAPVIGYRSPAFSSGQSRCFSIIVDAGYTYDASVFPAKRDTGGNPASPNYPYIIELEDGRKLYEFPVSCTRFLGRSFPNGGGYFRVYPLWLSRVLMRKMLRESSGYLMFYIHPREVDGGTHPRIDITDPKKRLKTYAGLKKTAEKLEYICEGFGSLSISNLCLKEDGKLF